MNDYCVISCSCLYSHAKEALMKKPGILQQRALRYQVINPETKVKFLIAVISSNEVKV